MPITVAHADATMRITIDRPPVNALDIEAIEELARTFADAADARPKGGVVLTGAGKAFSAGVDTRAFAAYDDARRAQMMHAITRMTARLLSITVPVVAAVNGHAMGGGFVLMLACDWRVAADVEGAKFALTEAQAGVPFPDGPLEIIRHELAPERLRQLTLTSAPTSAHELLQARVIDAIVPAGDLVATAIAQAARLGTQPAFETVKSQIRGGLAARVAALAA
jgi:enoyl-CoA hydratase